MIIVNIAWVHEEGHRIIHIVRRAELLITVLCGIAESRPSILVMVKSRVHLRYIFIIILNQFRYTDHPNIFEEMEKRRRLYTLKS